MTTANCCNFCSSKQKGKQAAHAGSEKNGQKMHITANIVQLTAVLCSQRPRVPGQGREGRALTSSVPAGNCGEIKAWMCNPQITLCTQLKCQEKRGIITEHIPVLLGLSLAEMGRRVGYMAGFWRKNHWDGECSGFASVGKTEGRNAVPVLGTHSPSSGQDEERKDRSHFGPKDSSSNRWKAQPRCYSQQHLSHTGSCLGFGLK